MTNTATTALICGISGQDGAYLAHLLLAKGYQVWGSSRDAQMSEFRNLVTLGIKDRVHLISMAPNDFRSVLSAMAKCEPDEVYFLAGQSSVGLSFEQPVETLESISVGTLNLLEAIRFTGKRTRFYHASSSECFGEASEAPLVESAPFQPHSPYAVAKASAHWMVANYREAYGLFACNGILFNHESPLRPRRFVTQKIITAVKQLEAGRPEPLRLGRMDIMRDWGWAPEYVEAMWRMLQQDTPDDYIIATGESHTLQEFVAYAFALVGADWRDHVESDTTLFRPSDLACSRANPAKAAQRLGWKAEFRMVDVIQQMLKA